MGSTGGVGPNSDGGDWASIGDVSDVSKADGEIKISDKDKELVKKILKLWHQLIATVLASVSKQIKKSQ